MTWRPLSLCGGAQLHPRSPKLGVSQSALSQTIRNLEARVGIRLSDPHDTECRADGSWRAAAPGVAPRFEEIDAELAAVSELRDKPAGTIRITLPRTRPMRSSAGPQTLLPDYPDIKVEIVIDYGLTDIVAERTMPASGRARRSQKT